YQRIKYLFSKRLQGDLHLQKRWLSLSQDKIALFRKIAPDLQDQIFQKNWQNFEGNLIWFHKLILVMKMDFKLHHFGFSTQVMQDLQLKLNRSIHFNDLFSLLKASEKRSIAEKMKDFLFLKLKYINQELYLLEDHSIAGEIQMKESLALYQELNHLLFKNAQLYLLSEDKTVLEALMKYFSKNKYVLFQDSNLSLISQKKETKTHLRLRKQKRLSKLLRNLLYLLNS
ncbi:hypothetical protein MJH12_08535, partial [bacterium]|nr:hypothetical protein [bacterium]